ncbi:MAG TPA: hypothetical protein VH912_18390 [Streptosporangiaceae bacterium]
MDQGLARDERDEHDPDPREAAPAESGPRRRRRWTRRRVLLVAIVGVLLTPFVAAGVALRLAYVGDVNAQARTRGHDAIWLGHAWVDGRRGYSDLAALAQHMLGSGIHDLYVHTGPLAKDGRLDPALHPRAAWAAQALRAAFPGVRVQAWLGQRLDGRDGLDLDDAATRARVLESARQVLDLGFGGVHYNFEPVPNGDRGLLDLLDGTRALVRARGGVLSMSAHHVEPLPGMSAVDDLVIGHTKWWSPGYLHQVATRVDQVAMMSYDTALPTRSLYGGYVRRQTDVALAAVPPQTELLMGLPAFQSHDLGHFSSAETVATAIHGVRLGLGADRRQRFGVALYIDFAATDADWAAYHADWGGPR